IDGYREFTAAPNDVARRHQAAARVHLAAASGSPHFGEEARGRNVFKRFVLRRYLFSYPSMWDGACF
ncbi:MAG: hypothetical protein ACXW1R_08530, partial [Halobacteriota archaeon]